MENIFSEPLPEGCPPLEARAPLDEGFFRLADSFPPTEMDFQSQKKKQPNRIFKCSECRALALSIYKHKQECENLKSLSKAFRKKVAVKVSLNQNSGLVLHTPEDGPTHHDWWMLREFNPIPYCAVSDV